MADAASTGPPDGRIETSSLGTGAMTPRTICNAAVRTLGLSGAGISMMNATGNSITVFASDDVAAELEELQFTLGEGPCVDAFRKGPVLIDDLGATEHVTSSPWPAFTSAAAAAGARALFAFPLELGAIRVGAFDLYRDRPGGLTDRELAIALTMAHSIAISLLDLRSIGSGEDGAAAGGSYHLEVHQATGMSKVQLGIGIDEAFVRLRAYAFAQDRPIHDVARDILAGQLRLDDEVDSDG